MATLYPNSIINSKSNAETKIFKIFKTFSDDFHIIHSLPWLSLLTAHERNRYTPEGEIDFIILHKNYGILCIEIKGGIISYRKHAYFTNGSHRIKNPYEQIRDSEHYLRNIIDNTLIGYCVGFPDSEKPNTVDDHPLITFDINDLDRLEDKIIGIFEFWKKSIKKNTPTESTIKSILLQLLPESKDELNQKIFYNNKQWLSPSKEQSNIIKNALKNNKFFIKGRAGTGKTILSIIMARILLKKNLKILFLTFNRPINKYIQNQFDDKNIHVYTFHKFLKEYRTSSNPLLKEEHISLESIIKDVDNSYDILIIDEAQSFSKVWLNLLNKYFENKKIYIFADSLQSFSNEGNISDKEMNTIFHFNNEMTLTKNYRSPRKVYERLLEIFSSSFQEVSPRDIDDLDLSENITTNPKAILHQIIDSLLNKGIDKDDIAILISSKEKENSSLFEYKDIKVETVHRYRGMEQPIIIYLITSASKDDLNELYIAYSRSTTQTIVIIPEIVVGLGKSKLKEILANSDFTDESLKRQIEVSSNEFNNVLISEYPKEIKIFKIRYSNKYFLFQNKEYKFINTLLQDYLLDNEICYLEISDYVENKAMFYSPQYDNFSVELNICEKCGKKTFLRGTFCLKCEEDEFKTINENKIINDINIMRNPEKYSNIEKEELHDSLKSLGRLCWILRKKKLKLTENTLKVLNHIDVMAISGIIEILIILTNHTKSVISIEEIRHNPKTKRFNGLNSRNWTTKTGHYINRFIMNGLLSGKKIYTIHKDKIFKDELTK